MDHGGNKLMQPIDYEVEYNNRARVPEHAQIMARWAADAALYCREISAHVEIGVGYGGSPRQYYDLFPCETERCDALVMFIHGGYWQALDPSSFSHMARGLNAHGVPVAVPGYNLCPDVTVTAIIDEMRNCAIKLWRRFHKPIVVAGHSAGGHLAACLIGTNWPKFAPDLPPALVRSALSLSGLFDLAPLTYTSINTKLMLDETFAKIASPLFWQAPAGLTFDAVVGGDESPEYLRQSRVMADIWGLEGVRTRFEAVPGANHFTIIEPLADPDSRLVARLAQLAGVRG